MSRIIGKILPYAQGFSEGISRGVRSAVERAMMRRDDSAEKPPQP